MHEDRGVIEARITREVRTRVLPLVHPAVRPLAARAGPSPSPASLSPISVGGAWGAPWGTTWFELTGEIAEEWSGERVEAVIDLGFDLDAPGFQCEGLLIDEDGHPVQGIHPRRTNVALKPTPGPVLLRIEAASNPNFPQFEPSPMGSLATAGEAPLYRFRRADLVVVDSQAEALLHDIEVLDGVMRTLDERDPRRAQLRTAMVAALDAVPDAGRARRALAPVLDTPARASAHHIVATGHAHIDTGWLWPVSETKRKCIRTFASAVALMDDDPDYRFACSQAQQYAWVEAEQPELFERIRHKVEAGQWIPVGGMWVEADMNLPSAESIARQIVMGQRYFQDRFGVRCTEAWIPDVFGYPAGLPQLFAAGGMRRFVTQKLSWNKTNPFPHHTFWWEGLDGTRVLTHFPPVDTYNAEIQPADLAHASANFRDHAWSRWSLMPYGYGDGGGGPTREMLARARRMADLDGMPTVHLGTPQDLFDAVDDEIRHGAPVPVWRGELYFETHRGTLTSQLRTKVGNRRCECLLYEVELWSAALGRPADVDDLWREVLTQQFHDILPGSSIAWVHADAEAVFERVAADLEARIAAQLTELTGGVAAIANPTARHHRAVVEIPVSPEDVGTRSGAAGAPSDTVPDPASAPVQALSAGGHAVMVEAPSLAAVPVTPLAPERRVIVTDRSMSNGRLAVRWNPDGAIVSMIDVAHARELLPTGERAALLELAPDHPVDYDAWDLESWTRDDAVVVESDDADDPVRVVESGPLLGRARYTRTFGPSSATITYTLRADSPRLDIEVDLDWHHDEHLVSMAFPLDVHADTAVCDVQLGVVHRPTHRSTSWDSAKFEVCAHRFVSLAEPDFGAAVLNDGRYGHSVLDGAIRVSLARAAKYPDPGADHGRHQVTLALMPHDGELDAVIEEAELLNRPIRVVEPDTDPATPPVATAPPATASGTATPTPAGSPVQVVGRGVEVDAIKLADDGSGDLIVRVHEHRGARTPVSLRAAHPIQRADRCNLLEERAESFEVSDGLLALVLRPFELATLRLSFGRDH